MATDRVNPTYAQLRRAVSKLVYERDGEWAGVPLPIEGFQLRIAPGYPRRELLEERFDRTPEGEADVDTERFEIINLWWDRKRQSTVVLVQSKTTGKVTHQLFPQTDVYRRLALLMNTMLTTGTLFDIQAELRAVTTLSDHVEDHQFKLYLLTGAFIETSPRSQVSYVFRKGRPTLAVRQREDASFALLVALCQHPIGYYSKTFTGSMTPTDDVLAHLLMMRADEPLFWRRSNQHSLTAVEAGL